LTANAEQTNNYSISHGGCAQTENHDHPPEIVLIQTRASWMTQNDNPQSARASTKLSPNQNHGLRGLIDDQDPLLRESQNLQDEAEVLLEIDLDHLIALPVMRQRR
jgi:hypothetical protein